MRPFILSICCLLILTSCSSKTNLSDNKTMVFSETVTNKKTTNFVPQRKATTPSLTKSGYKVTILPIATLQKQHNGCEFVISLRYSSIWNYELALIEFRNRGGALGANALGITNLIASGDDSFLAGTFYRCRDLSKL